MKLNLLKKLLFAGILLSFSSGQVFAAKNVLLIIADDLGTDVLDVDLEALTAKVRTGPDADPAFKDLPNISQLLANGLYFTNAWANPVCSPTRASIYTGMYPWRTGVGWADDNSTLEDTLPDGVTDTKTIADAICSTGARTCGLFGKWHLGNKNTFSVTPLNRGWNYYAGDLREGDLVSYRNWTKYTPNDDGDGYNDVPKTMYATRDVVTEAKEWIANQPGNWFATIALNTPHQPFEVPPSVSYDNSSSNPTDTSDDTGKYNAMIQSMDYYIGQLWAVDWPTSTSSFRDITSELANTIIIFVGDNGTPGQVSQLANAKNSVFLGGVHVPLIVTDGAKLVGNSTANFFHQDALGSSQSNPANVTDLYRSIIGLTGGNIPSGIGLDSYSLNKYFKNSTPTNRRIFNFAQMYIVQSSGADKAYATISDGTHKLNYNDGTYTLYNIVNDPGEEDNLYNASDPSTAQTTLLTEIKLHRPTADTAILFP